MRKPLSRHMLLAISAVVLLAGCGKETATEQQGTEKTEDAVVGDWTDKEFEITFFANNGQKQEEIDFWFGDALRQKFPKMKLNWLPTSPGNTMPEMLAAGQKFDIFFTTRGTYEQLAYSYNIQQDMTALIKTHQVDLSRIEPVLLDEVGRTSGGKLYMLPVQNNIQLLYYNKDLFDQFGVPYPRDGMTWDEMLDVAKRITRKDGDKLYYGFSNQGAGFSIKMNQMSLVKADPVTGKVMVNQDPKWKTMFDLFFVRPYHNSAVFAEYFAKSAAPPALNQFYKEQSTAMTTYIASLLGQAYADQYLNGFNWDIVTMPTLPNYPNVGTQADPIYFGMTNMARDKDAAMEVLKFLISDEYQARMARQANMTVLKDKKIQDQTGLDLKGGSVGKNYAALYKLPLAPMAPINPKVDTLIVTELSKYANELAKGTSDINTLLSRAEEEIQKKVDAELAK